MKIENSCPAFQQLKRNNELKQTARNAAGSAILSAGLTFAINKGHCGFKTAAKVGGLAAGISVAIDLVRGLINKSKTTGKNKFSDKCEFEKPAEKKLCTHQG